MNHKKGSSYVFIIVIMVTVFMMTNILLHISSKPKTIIYANKKDSNNYHLAIAGAVKALNLVNSNLEDNLYEMKKETTNTILSNNVNDIIYYKVNTLSDKYNGVFHLKEKDANSSEGKLDSFYKKTSSEKMFDFTSSYLYSNFLFSNDNYQFSYDVSLGEEDFEKYTIVVDIILDKNTNQYLVSSKAKNIGTNNHLVVEAFLKENENQSDETIQESYSFLNILDWFNYPIHTQGLVVQNDLSPIDFYIDSSIDVSTTFDNIVNNSVQLESSNWSKENTIINKHTENLDIDISEFYKEENPLPTIIINSSETGSINIFASDSSKNHFYGIIVSYGEIFINGNVFLEGNIFSKNNVHLENANLQYIKNTECIFHINASIDTKRKLLDKFNITDFKSINAYNTTNYAASIDHMLKNAKVTIKTIYINDIDSNKYIFNDLKQVDK